jgi:hypothetical protein
MLNAERVVNERSTALKTGADFSQVFHEDMHSLYRLSFLLTVNHEKAEQVFVASLEDSVDGPPVFEDWARSWVRRRIIQNAVKIIKPQPIGGNAISNSDHAHIRALSKTNGASNVDRGALPTFPAEISAILDLRPFERFVFVMSVLERYIDQDSAILLGSRRRDVIAARVRALQQIGISTAVRRTQRVGVASENQARLKAAASVVEIEVARWLAEAA